MRLPHRFLAALAAVAFSAPAQAQLIPSVGIAGGFNFASLNDVGDARIDNTTGWHIGVYGDMGIGPLAVRPGVFYLRAGEVRSESAGDLITADFITVPVDLRLQTPLPVVKAYALAGPELRFPVGDGGDLVNTRDVNLAVNVGAGVALDTPIFGPRGFLELRYAIDATGFAEATGASDGDSDYRVSLFMVRGGIGL